MSINITQWNVIGENNWSGFVRRTYGRPYRLQQQEDCAPNDSVIFIDTDENFSYDFENKTIPETLSGKCGVNFNTWLKRNPKEKVKDINGYDITDLWWERNFYPEVNTVAADLCKRGLLPAGEYVIYVHSAVSWKW